jgi:hypothetical protein
MAVRILGPADPQSFVFLETVRTERIEFVTL